MPKTSWSPRWCSTRPSCRCCPSAVRWCRSRGRWCRSSGSWFRRWRCSSTMRRRPRPRGCTHRPRRSASVGQPRRRGCDERWTWAAERTRTTPGDDRARRGPGRPSLGHTFRPCSPGLVPADSSRTSWPRPPCSASPRAATTIRVRAASPSTSSRSATPPSRPAARATRVRSPSTEVRAVRSRGRRRASPLRARSPSPCAPRGPRCKRPRPRGSTTRSTCVGSSGPTRRPQVRACSAGPTPICRGSASRPTRRSVAP